ncbi:MAG: 3 beta-hydroxysteroid dehydrogenase/Delta 5--_4-isomerase [Opitutia bacterium UBA7350]|nr:MAG: 3 beta-hydroxysteroid dehydrogenase/Delta 5-->4-isomerase [Opitutae bacterium UBA7350]
MERQGETGMKVLVTGGGGFVGRHLIDRLLARGYFVRSFGRSAQPDLETQGVECHRGDLADAAAVTSACTGMNAVFHVAAKAGIWGSWNSFYAPNVLGARHIVKACRQHGIKRLVYTSTPSVVFNRRAFCGADESLPYGSRWLCHYAHTKAIAEQETLAANDSDLQIVALRPHLVFGPGDPHLIPRIIEKAQAGRLRIVGNGQSQVDVSYVENVADAHLNALDALNSGKAAGKAYFISQGEPVALWPWINALLESLGKQAITRTIPLPIAYSLGGLCESLWQILGRTNDPPMTRFVAVELAKDHYFDVRAAQNDLNYKPKIGMEEALKKTVADLRQRRLA